MSKFLILDQNNWRKEKKNLGKEDSEFRRGFGDRDLVAATSETIDEIQMCSKIMEQSHQKSLLYD